MTSKATVTRTRSGILRGSIDPQALSRELDSLKSDVSGIKRVLAPAFTAPKESTTVAEPSPPRSVTTSNGTTNWSVYPDHDPEYLAGQITLEQARARHQRPDEGCGCPNCVHQRKQAAPHRRARDRAAGALPVLPWFRLQRQARGPGLAALRRV